MRQRQPGNNYIYPPLLHCADQAKKLKNINSIVSTLYYVVHGHLESIVKKSSETEEAPPGDKLHRTLETLLKQTSAFFDDVEQLIANLATVITELKQFMQKHLPESLPNFCAILGLYEGKKWENIMCALDNLRTAYKVISHKKKINFTVKNALVASKLFQLFEKREKHLILEASFAREDAKSLTNNLIGYKSTQEESTTNYTKQLKNGLSIFLKTNASYKILGVSIFTNKELHKDVNADSIPPFGSTSFRLTILAKQNVTLYESFATSDFRKSFVAITVSVEGKNRIG